MVKVGATNLKRKLLVELKGRGPAPAVACCVWHANAPPPSSSNEAVLGRDVIVIDSDDGNAHEWATSVADAVAGLAPSAAAKWCACVAAPTTVVTAINDAATAATAGPTAGQALKRSVAAAMLARQVPSGILIFVATKKDGHSTLDVQIAWLMIASAFVNDRCTQESRMALQHTDKRARKERLCRSHEWCTSDENMWHAKLEPLLREKLERVREKDAAGMAAEDVRA
jgi:hypothetical protein